jgi:FeS assembly SUF system protein
MRFLSRLFGRDEPGDHPPPPPDDEPSGSLAREDAGPGLDDIWNFGSLTVPPPPKPGVTTPPSTFVADSTVTAELAPKVVSAVKTVFDPEIPVDIYELGLIYEIAADATRHVHVKMTLTSPACPSAQQLPSEVRFKIKALDGVSDATVDIVWEPPWDKDRMSDAAKLQLGIF